MSYGLWDSPIALLAWIREKLQTWTDSYPWTDDEIITWVRPRSFPAISWLPPCSLPRCHYPVVHYPRCSLPPLCLMGFISLFSGGVTYS